MFSFFKRKKKEEIQEKQQDAIAPIENDTQTDSPHEETPLATSAKQTSTPTTSDPTHDNSNENHLPNEELTQKVDKKINLTDETSSDILISENNDINKPSPEQRQGWLTRLRTGLRKTGKSITEVFTGTQIDDTLYEELETALLMADAGTAATQYLLDDVKERVKATKTTDPAAVRQLLQQALTDLLQPLEASLTIGEHTPTVIMVAGVNGAGKTTSIGKLTRHLANTNHKILLAAGDTFRAAARQQLEVWADRNMVEIIAQEKGDPASVSFDAVAAGKARKIDVVIVDTAGRLATQPHLMDELKKIRRVINKAMESAPHEVLLVVDGNTGQNALTQVKAFDQAINLTGLIVTKLDGTAKGGIIAAIALWSAEREKTGKEKLPIYFIGVGEQIEDLQTFSAQEFTQALLSL